MKKLLTFFAITAILAIAGCGSSTSGGDSSTLDQAKEEGKITVGFANERPYAYMTADGEIKGEAVDIAKEIFNNLGIEDVEGTVTEFGSLINGLHAGNFDVITAGMYITPDRCEKVEFAEPEYRIGEGFAVQLGNPLDLHSYEDIANNPDATIGVMNGAIEIDYLEAAGVSEEQMVIVPDIPSNISALETGRVDAITMTDLTLRTALEDADSDKIEIVEDFQQPVIDGKTVYGYGAAAFRPEDKEFVEAYNKELKKLKESGKLLELLEPYGFTEDNLPGDVTKEELCEG